MCESKPKKDIIALMGKQNKKQDKITHQAIRAAFVRNNGKKK